MSAFYNQRFTTDPVGFINHYTVDIKTWFEGLARSHSVDALMGGQLIKMNSLRGWGYFDLESIGGLGFGINTVELRMVFGTIGAHWVPYQTGPGLPGFADVKRKNPDYPFVFTAGMNGCAWVVTNSPKGAAWMRVYHHQHPDDNPDTSSVWQSIARTGQHVISYAGPEDYSGGSLGHGVNPVAFNFLYYRKGTWIYVFQPQSFNAASQAPPQRLIGQATTRSVF